MNQLGIIAIAGTVAALGFAGAANAADMPAKASIVKAPIVAPNYNWTGLYIGINGGYGWNNRTGNSLCTDPTGVVLGAGCDLPNTGIIKPAGGLFGAQVGYNWQAGPLVYGLETDFQWSGIKDSKSVNVFNGAPGVYSASANLQWFGTFRGRLGYAWDRVLLYATGGLFYGHESLSANLVYVTTAAYPQSGSTTRAGWTVGGGLEYAFTQNLSARLDGLYYDMGSSTISATNLGNGFTEATSFTYRGGIVRGGLNWKFM